jgi:hypothetical protein
MKVRNVVYLIVIIYFVVLVNNNVYAFDPCELSDIVEIEVDLFYDIIPKRSSFLDHLFGSSRANRSDMKLIVNLPQTIKNRQEITKLKFEPLPSRIFIENSNKYAEYIFPLPKVKTQLKIHIEAKTSQYNLAIAIKESNKRLFDDPNLNLYLQHERMIEKDDPIIRDIAESLQGQTELDIVKNIYKYVISNLSFDASKLKGVGAVKTAQTKTGMCIDYCDLFVALCRAKNIPARVVAGYKPYFFTSPKHSWVEVYFKEYGWVPFSAILSSKMPEKVLDKLFYNSKVSFLRFTNLRNDNLLNNNYFYFYPYWDKNFRKNIKSVIESIEFKKPLSKQHDSLKDIETARKAGHIK